MLKSRLAISAITFLTCSSALRISRQKAHVGIRQFLGFAECNFCKFRSSVVHAASTCWCLLTISGRGEFNRLASLPSQRAVGHCRIPCSSTA